MAKLRKHKVTTGVYFVEAKKAGLNILCGCPADTVKHLMRRGLIMDIDDDGVQYETGPNAILLSDVMVQGGDFCNLGEFPVLQMLYRQGMIIPNHPNNTGRKPMLIGSQEQIDSQLQYIYRGNYGLISKDEMIDAGCSEEEAEELMRIKLHFAFGSIREPDQLLDSAAIVDDKPTDLGEGLTVQRTAMNKFVFRLGNEEVEVDLNLKPNERYLAPYPLGFYQVHPAFFSVIHAGEGDGWDINRPCLGSLLSFQGHFYLIDAGPNIQATLTALGIGVNELKGIFHTHSHDDHFAGLTALLRADHRLKYYATPLVRSAVTKKLSALLSIEEKRFSSFFDVVDLKPDDWNEVDGLQVKPINAPHPVENTIFQFRTLWSEGYCSYGHYADLTSRAVLDRMVTEDDSAPGISQDKRDEILRNYLDPLTLKKLDIGGGMIHGEAQDFDDDYSDKIVMGHIARELTPDEKTVGSGAPFGTSEMLVPSYQDYVRRNAHGFLTSYYPNTRGYRLHSLLNNEVVTFNPLAILVREGDLVEDLYLVLTGSIEMVSSDEATVRHLSAGALIGELSVIQDRECTKTYRATSFVKALKLPARLYLEFVNYNELEDQILLVAKQRMFLQATWLFGEELSYPVQNRIANAMVYLDADSDPLARARQPDAMFSLFLVAEGRLGLEVDGEVVEEYQPGDFFNEQCIFGAQIAGNLVALDESLALYEIPVQSISDIPVVRWKLMETHRKRVVIEQAKRLQIAASA